MKFFVDTSAFHALLDEDDRNHEAAAGTWRDLLHGPGLPVTSNYVVLETMALLQRRLGLDAVRSFCMAMLPAVELLFVTREAHRVAQAALLVGGRRGVSLVDIVSFHMMREYGIERVLAFDRHFSEQGFKVLGSTAPGTGSA